MMRTVRQRGDTLIEVLVAGAVFSLVAVGGLGIMNRGTLVAQRSLEITLVRQQLDAQAETLRYIHEDYVSQYDSAKPATAYTGAAAQWVQIKSRAKAAASTYQLTACPASGVAAVTAPSANSFILDPLHAQMASTPYTAATTYSQLRYDTSLPDPTLLSVDGLWMEVVQNSSLQTTQPVKYYDVHIRACWIGPDSVIATLGTIVRLYEPNA